jgi:hypothetical protein
MGQAFDSYGNVLGEAFGGTKRDVFDKLMAAHGDAAEIRIRSLSPASGVPDAPSVQMPRYKCHKDVWALKIRDISDPTQPGNESDGSRLLHFSEEGYGARRVSREFVQKHIPLAGLKNHPYVGGYFVVYKDGYESFSPADAFEEGYSPVSQ